jgi:dihydroneopterin aldolase
MDLISIDSLVYSGTHGVHKREKHEQQRFSIDLDALIDTRRASTSDHISDALDYGPIRNIIREVIEGESFDLIEKIADTIATRTLADARISAVRVTVRKLDIWGNGTPRITIIRPYGTDLITHR